MQITDVSPNDDNFTPSFDRVGQSVSGKALCAALSADGTRAYLGGHSGVWRSDDGGLTWWHPEWPPATPGGPTPPGALPPTNVYDLVVHPANNDLVFALTGRDGREPSQAGIYRSADGAQSWQRVHQFARTIAGISTVGLPGRLATVPDDPQTLYAACEFAVAWTTDGGQTWTESVPDPSIAVFHVVAGPRRPGGRRVYAIGHADWYSLDGGITWHRDPVGLLLGAATDGAGASARALALHPQLDNVVYLMRGDLTLWKGVYPNAPSTGAGTWTQLPSPPIAGDTDSGGTFVVAHLSEEGFVTLFVSDRRSVHLAAADPSTTEDWVRAEDNHCHVDPHGLSLTPDFRPWSPDFDPPTWGRALLVNDGGANVSVDGMQSWSNGRGLSTLSVVNVGVNTVAGGGTAITFGTGDNEGFSSNDDAGNWATQDYLGGDNDCSFADPLQPTRAILFAPRSVAANGVGGEIYLYTSPSDDPPNTVIGSPQRLRIPAPPAVTDMLGAATRGWNVVSHYYNYCYRPLVLTLPGQVPRPDGDIVVIRFTGVVGVDPALVLRTTALSTIIVEDDWVTSETDEGPGVKSFQVGPQLPDPLISAVQASGGHDRPAFYAGNAAPTVKGLVGSLGLWKFRPGDTVWRQIVPHTGPPFPPRGPTIARRFFVDPYRPQLVYVIGEDHIYRSDDGGTSWNVDGSFGAAVTESGTYPFDVGDTANPAEAVIRDMQFDPHRPGFRLAAGIAGVFLTTDGHTWRPLLRSSSMAVQPANITYDWVACDRAVYLGTSNRGLLRLSPLPPDWEFPIGSLQAAQGHITLLRVHDPGTGYGPPYDFLDTEIVVWLDTQPEKAFGLQLRANASQHAAEGMLALLRDCFNRNRPVRIDFIRTGCRTAEIVRVIEIT